MKRWDVKEMLSISRTLFAKIHRKKHHAHHNHDVHFMARELNDWLGKGINALVEGGYTPRFLKRCYFKDEMIDQLHLLDRVLQHILLKQLKPTFPYVMNLIKSDYKSICHRQLIKDIQTHYKDPKLLSMLERIVTNPIETPRGYKNPDTGIALRSPLSQFFSGLYLKPLDDAFDGMNVAYFRYQDDILILCQTKRSLNRCTQRLMQVLHERKLRVSGKKTRMGSIDKGFHFLGIQYPETQSPDNTHVAQTVSVGHILPNMGGGRSNRATQRTVFANTYRSSCKDFAKSTRTSQMDGRRWGFSPTYQKLLGSMVYVVGKNISKLAVPGLAFMVFEDMLE